MRGMASAVMFLLGLQDTESATVVQQATVRRDVEQNKQPLAACYVQLLGSLISKSDQELSSAVSASIVSEPWRSLREGQATLLSHRICGRGQCCFAL